MNLFKLPILCLAIASVAACGGKSHEGKLADGATGNMEQYESTDVNAIVQAKPEIMVIPSDQFLKSANCLNSRKVEGEQRTVRNYHKFLLENTDFKMIVSKIQQSFIDEDFPLNDFEQTLKSLDTQRAEDIADNLNQDSKTRLLQTVSPDIVLEFSYDARADYSSGNNPDKKVSYLINAIDAYTNKVIASVNSENLEGKDVINTISADFKNKIPALMGDIQKYFNDILTRGREITVRINVAADSNQNLSDINIEGDTYADAIIDYIKANTIKGAYKMQTNTANQLTFTNVRIKVLNDNGTQYGVYDWTRDLQKHLRKNLGLSADNRSQGLGEVVLTIKGM